MVYIVICCNVCDRPIKIFCFLSSKPSCHTYPLSSWNWGPQINQSQALKRWPASCNRPREPAPFSVNRIWPLACPALRFRSLFSSLVPLLYLNLDQRAHVNQLTGALISGPWSASFYFFLFANIYICEIDYTRLSGCVTKAPRWTSPMDRRGSCKVTVTEPYCAALWLRFESI